MPAWQQNLAKHFETSHMPVSDSANPEYDGKCTPKSGRATPLVAVLWLVNLPTQRPRVFADHRLNTGTLL